MRMEGKSVVITGAGSGLGRECALLLAGEGAKVVTSDAVHGRAEAVAEEIRAAGAEAVGVQVDVRSEEQVAGLVRTAVDTFDRIDVMHANAGIPEPGFGSGRLEELALEDWNRIFEVNVTGVYLAFKHAARQMISQGSGGTLLATSSVASFVAFPGFPAYSASKAAVNGLVRSAAFEWGPHGIRVNAVCPTHGTSANFALAPDAPVLGKSYEQMQGPWDPDKRAMPLRLPRAPNLRDNANLVLFLASDEAMYMSGQCISSADGGTMARAAMIFPSDVEAFTPVADGAR